MSKKWVIVRVLNGQNTKAATNTNRIADCLGIE
jgi:transcription antitermination factor NusG